MTVADLPSLALDLLASVAVLALPWLIAALLPRVRSPRVGE